MKKTPKYRESLYEKGWFFVGAAGRSRAAFLFPPGLPKVWPAGRVVPLLLYFIQIL